ncbi:MAG: rRNA maturation RNase YbeY [Anaeroplasmataceae bacterium]
MNINFTNQTEYNVDKYIQIIESIFKNVNNDKEFNIIFTTNEIIKDINNQYRQKDYVTDVISFAINEDEQSFLTEELGDIFICIDQAIKQSEEYNHSIEREIGFLAVHGYLHLTGYDHNTLEEEKEMFNLQEDILNKSNLFRKKD